ncbi:MAG: efflux RND transporter permease subunit [Lachnospiraceae bacterium]|nr:efflux RND transporter permease subunit [Lachnospiraceae bacterium]
MISKLSVKKPFTVLVGVILVLVLGFVSVTKMSTDLLPNINLPYVIIMTTYVGANPETVETVVTEPVEESMATISNIKNVSSRSAENYSVVILEFNQSADMNTASLEIRESLDQLESYWDDSVGSPVVMKLNPNMLPIMIAAVGAEGMDDAEVGEFVEEKIAPAIKSIEGVASVSTSGLLEDSIHVVISEDKIAEVNARIATYIDDKFADAYQEIEDGKEELAKGEKDLAKAEREVNNGQKKLDDGKKDLEKGKNELNNKKNETLDQLNDAKLKLLTGKADLEAAKTNINTNITTADALFQGYQGLIAANTALADPSTEAHYTTDIQAAFSGYQTVKAGYDAAVIGYDQAVAALALSPDDTDLQAAVANAEAGVQTAAGYVEAAETGLSTLKTQLTSSQTGTLGMLFTDDVRNAIKAIDFTSAGAATQYSTVYNTYKATLAAQKTSVENQLTGLIGGTTQADLNSYKATQKGALAEIDKNIKTVDENILKVYDGESEAVIGFANGLSQIDLAEYQLNQSQAQIDSGKETIKTSKESIKDAKEKLKDGEEQLEDAKADALEKADMAGNLTVDTVSKLLTAQNFSMPAGYVEEDGVSYMIRVGDKPDNIDDLRDMVLLKLPLSEDEVITLNDVADVFDTDNSSEVYTNVNGERGVVLTIQKQTGYSTGNVSDAITEKFESLQETYPDATFVTLMDQGIYIDMIMSSIMENVLYGGLLAILVLIIFLRDIKPTAIIAASIPISMVFAVVAMYFSGVTLNIISLSGLALGVGMLVDNSIVVIENIYRMRNEGKGVREAAIEGAKEVSGAIIASTLTTVCVFLPIVFTEGITRQLFVDMGLTIAYSLFASLIVALTVVPALASVSLKKVRKVENRTDRGFYKGYAKFLRGALKIKPIVLIVAIGLTVLSAFLATKNGTAFFPDMASTQITVSLSPEEGSGITDVKDETNTMVSRLLELPDVVDVGAMAQGSDLALMAGFSESSETVDNSVIYVTTKEDRDLTTDELVAKINELGSDLEGISLSIETSTMDMSALGGSGVSVNIMGRDLNTLYEVAEDASEIMKNTEGVGSVSSDIDTAGDEVRILVDREKAGKYNLTVAQVFQQIYPHLATPGVATKLSTAKNDISVYVEDGSDKKLTRDDIKNMMISYTNEEGESEEISLSEIATFKDAKGFNTITRDHQTRYISVTANLADGYNIGLVATDIEENMKELNLPEGYTIEFAGENEMINDALKQLMLMLVLAVVFVYLIMVAQFQSLFSPFIIMFTIPLAFTGGFLALYFTGFEMSIVAMIGFVMLSGIIVNNGIVLVDYINQRRAEGLSKKDAIIEAGITRLRPVLMTALTTILALVIMAFSTKMGADMSRPLAIVVIGGLAYGTLMTLVVVPCIYDMFARDKKHKNTDSGSGSDEDEYVEIVEGVAFEDEAPEIVAIEEEPAETEVKTSSKQVKEERKARKEEKKALKAEKKAYKAEKKAEKAKTSENEENNKYSDILAGV